MSAAEYFNRPVNMTYHNICNKKKPPDGIRVTLGLGLKFCIHQDKPKNAFQRSFSPFTDDVRKRYLFAGSALDCNTPKNFFVKPDFIPEPATEHVEDRMSKFYGSILAEHKFLHNNTHKSSKLTLTQKSHLNLLRSNEDFIILNSDKNLGSAIMERETYIKSVLEEHLLDENTYENLMEQKALEMIRNFEKETWEILN